VSRPLQYEILSRGGDGWKWPKHDAGNADMSDGTSPAMLAADSINQTSLFQVPHILPKCTVGNGESQISIRRHMQKISNVYIDHEQHCALYMMLSDRTWLLKTLR